MNDSTSTSPTRTTLTGLTVEHVAWGDPRAEALRTAMEAEMSVRYAGRDTGMTPEKEAALNRALAVDPAAVHVTVLVSNEHGTPVGHAALKWVGHDLEMKRVIVDSSTRGTGIGALLMVELEAAARAEGVRRIILQTGDRQPEAVRLYERSGYKPIPIYEPYASTIPFSLCFEKLL